MSELTIVHVSAVESNVDTVVEGVRFWGENTHCYDAKQVRDAVLADLSTGASPMTVSETVLYLHGVEHPQGKTWDNWLNLDKVLESWIGCCV